MTWPAALLERLGCSPEELKRNEAVAELAKRAASLDMNALAAELQVGPLLLADVVAQLTRPGRDPREDLPQPIFKRGILKLEDLAAGMELQGTVLNVVDFGVFVDIGLRDSGLVHVSQLANRYVRDPHEVAAVGDIVKVWVMEIDKTRRRVSLTMIAPGAKQAHPPRHHGPKSQGAKSRPGECASGPRTTRWAPRGNRPPRPAKPAATAAPPAGAPLRKATKARVAMPRPRRQNRKRPNFARNVWPASEQRGTAASTAAVAEIQSVLRSATTWLARKSARATSKAEAAGDSDQRGDESRQRTAAHVRRSEAILCAESRGACGPRRFPCTTKRGRSGVEGTDGRFAKRAVRSGKCPERGAVASRNGG